MQPSLPDELLAEIESRAVEMSLGAWEVLRRYFGGPLQVKYKGKGENDPVTAADKESQEYLQEAIARHFPDHGILGEEDTGTEGEDRIAPDLVWVLDPLDGTKNFVGGLPVYACSVGVLYLGAPVVGAVFIPWPNQAGGLIMHARTGAGARVDGVPVSVTDSDEPKGNGLVALPASFGAAFSVKKPMRGKLGEVRNTGSIAYELLMVAKGALQYTVSTAPRLWDVAGGVVLVREAGGAVMVGRQSPRLRIFPELRWEPLESFVQSWHSGKTTMQEMRRWSAPLLSGSPGVVRFVSANLGSRLLLRHRLSRLVKRVARRDKQSAHRRTGPSE